MSASPLRLKKSLLVDCLNWFVPYVRHNLIVPLEAQFPSHAVPHELRIIDQQSVHIQEKLKNLQDDVVDVTELIERDWQDDPIISMLLKQIILLYRRNRATYVEDLLAKTFHPDLTAALKAEIDQMDAFVAQESFRAIQHRRIPKLKDFLPLQFAEELGGSPSFPPRAFDDKFHVLFAPGLFLQDLAYIRAKCESRDVPVVVAFLDIDHFKTFNENYDETFVDRNLLPRLMQCIESHVYHHGFAYRQGGDEYLLVIPSFSKVLALTFLDELRCKLADMEYPGIQEKLTVSIGVFIAEPDCPLTDRELLERANKAKKEAKRSRNCIVPYRDTHG